MGLFRNVSDCRLVGLQVRERVGAVKADSSACRLQQTRQDFDCRAFARPVGTKQSENLSCSDREGDVLYASERPIAFGQMLDVQHASLDTVPAGLFPWGLDRTVAHSYRSAATGSSRVARRTG